MKTPFPSLLVLGAGPAARVFASILDVPVIDWNDDGTNWEWPRGTYPDSMKLVLMAPGDGVDRIIRCHAKARLCSKASRIGVVILGVTPQTRGALLSRDVFGRKGETNDRFAEWSDVTKIVDLNQPLEEMLSALVNVKCLPVATWKRLAGNANCIPALLKALSSKDRTALGTLVPQAQAIYWDALCSHSTANSIARWLDSAVPGAEPDWELGLRLFSLLVTR